MLLNKFHSREGKALTTQQSIIFIDDQLSVGSKKLKNFKERDFNFCMLAQTRL